MSDVLICAVKREAVEAILTATVKIWVSLDFTSPEFAFIGEKSTAESMTSYITLPFALSEP